MAEFISYVIMASILLWACWHWFLGNWLKSSGFLGFMKARYAINKIPDEVFYEQVAREIKNGEIRDGLWAKAWAESRGDDNKAKAIYINMRVSSLKSQAANGYGDRSQSFCDQTSIEPQKTIVTCSQCGVNLRIPVGSVFNVKCTKCGHEFEANTISDIKISEYGPKKDQKIGRIGRLRFFVFWLLCMIAGVISFVLFKEVSSRDLIIYTFAFSIAATYFNFSIIIARFHDLDKSGWWSILCLIPFVYIAVVFYLLVLPVTKIRNRFGLIDSGVFL